MCTCRGWQQNKNLLLVSNLRLPWKSLNKNNNRTIIAMKYFLDASCMPGIYSHLPTVNRTFCLSSFLSFINLWDIWRNLYFISSSSATFLLWEPLPTMHTVGSCPDAGDGRCQCFGSKLIWGRWWYFGIRGHREATQTGDDLGGQNLINLIKWPGKQMMKREDGINSSLNKMAFRQWRHLERKYYF